MNLGAPVPPGPFSIAIEHGRDAVRIAPSGELDLATVEQFQHALGKLTDAMGAQIVVDLHDVEFLDSTGLRALLRAHAHAQSNGWELAIIPGPPAVQRLFELTGMLERLPFSSANGRPASPSSFE